MSGAIHNDRICWSDNSSTDKLEQTCKRCPGCWLGRDALHFCKNVHGAKGFLIAHTLKDASSFIHLLPQHHIRPARIARGKCFDTRLRRKDWLGFFETLAPTE